MRWERFVWWWTLSETKLTNLRDLIIGRFLIIADGGDLVLQISIQSTLKCIVNLQVEMVFITAIQNPGLLSCCQTPVYFALSKKKTEILV